MKIRMRRIFLSAVCLCLFVFSLSVSALPTGESPLNESEATYRVLDGKTAEVKGNGDRERVVLRWDSFDIGKDEILTFDEKDYLILIGGDAPTEILGIINGGGNLYLINPNGILFGADSVINLVGSLSVSTRAIGENAVNEFRAGGTIPEETGSLAGDILCLGAVSAKTVFFESREVTLSDLIFSEIHARTEGEIKIGFRLKSEAPIGTEDGELQGKLAAMSDRLSLKKTDGSDAIPTPFRLAGDLSDLKNMRNDPSGNYLLEKDIDATSVRENEEEDKLAIKRKEKILRIEGKRDGFPFIGSVLSEGAGWILIAALLLAAAAIAFAVVRKKKKTKKSGEDQNDPS